MNNACFINKVKCNEREFRPIIIDFQNGLLREGQQSNLSCGLYKDSDNKILVAAATEANLIYSGSISPNNRYNTFIGIHNKNKNKMRLMAVDYATLSPMLQEEQEHNSISESQNISKLFKQFGSKKAKRQTEQHERMKMDVENVKEQLEQTVADIKVDAQDMVVPTIHENSNYRPPINRSAVKVEEIYSLNDVVSSEILNSLSKEVNHILENDVKDANLTAFVSHYITNLQKSSSISKEVTYQLLLYIDCLIKFMNKPAKEISVKKCSLCSYSELVHDDILKKYTIVSGKSRLRPTTMRDKCMCSILVLSMIACNYKINLEMLSKELKLGLKRMQDISKILAFNVSKELAILKLPLPSPVSIVKRDRKRSK